MKNLKFIFISAILYISFVHSKEDKNNTSAKYDFRYKFNFSNKIPIKKNIHYEYKRRNDFHFKFINGSSGNNFVSPQRLNKTFNRNHIINKK